MWANCVVVTVSTNINLGRMKDIVEIVDLLGEGGGTVTESNVSNSA